MSETMSTIIPMPNLSDHAEIVVGEDGNVTTRNIIVNGWSSARYIRKMMDGLQEACEILEERDPVKHLYPEVREDGIFYGYAFARNGDYAVKASQAAQKRIESLGLKNPIVRSYGYSSEITVILDDEVTKDLHPYEKLILADSGNGAFGGIVKGNVVKVYID